MEDDEQEDNEETEDNEEMDTEAVVDAIEKMTNELSGLLEEANKSLDDIRHTLSMIDIGLNVLVEHKGEK